MGETIGFVQSIIDGDQLRLWVIAALIIIVTAILSGTVTKLIRKLMQVDGLPLPASSIIVNIARTVIWLLGISLMLSACFNVDVNALLAALGVGGIAISLGLQDTIKNLIGGLQITLTGMVRPGDHISVNGVEGMVQDVSWRQTTVLDFERVTHLIPNSIMSSTTVSRIEPSNIVTTVVVLNTDGRDIDEVLREMELLARREVLKVAKLEKDPWILVTHIGEYGIWAKMRFVLEGTDHAREARDAAMRAIAPYTRINSDQVLLEEGEED